MAIENTPKSETREFLIGETAEYVYFGTIPALNEDELKQLPVPSYTSADGKEIVVDRSYARGYPDGQLEIGFPRWAFDGIQQIQNFAQRSAEALGGCAIRKAIIPIMDPRHSLVEHIR